MEKILYITNNLVPSYFQGRASKKLYEGCGAIIRTDRSIRLQLVYPSDIFPGFKYYGFKINIENVCFKNGDLNINFPVKSMNTSSGNKSKSIHINAEIELEYEDLVNNLIELLKKDDAQIENVLALKSEIVSESDINKKFNIYNELRKHETLAHSNTNLLFINIVESIPENEHLDAVFSFIHDMMATN